MRHQLFSIVLLLHLLLFWGACNRCPDVDKNMGEIVSDWSPGNFCQDLSDGIVVIQDDSTLQAVYANCNLGAPEVDFNQYAILGIRTEGGCKLYNERDVTIDEQAETVDYVVRFRECGRCKSLEIDLNLVLVPQFPPDFTVNVSASPLP